MQRNGGVPLPIEGSRSLRLGNFKDEFGDYELQLTFLRQLSAWEVVATQASHVKAQLYFCRASRTTHLVLAVHSVLHRDGTGVKIPRNVLHCYALVWSKGWHIISGNGKTTSLSFSRHRQTIPELMGATVVQLFCLVARASAKPSNNRHEPGNKYENNSIHFLPGWSSINDLYGGSLKYASVGVDVSPSWHTPSALSDKLTKWMESRLLDEVVQFGQDNVRYPTRAQNMVPYSVQQS